ncbi:MAG: anti-sigma-factor antagonist [Solirubrobacterales bacterium]|jgi:anti-sigma B factor antagonist|nr:anti-sigma-factor antagonist [Solirubrobacterales bacterium]
MCTNDGRTDEHDGKGRCSEPVPRLTVRETTQGARQTLFFSGELDLASRPLFDEVVARVHCHLGATLIIDLSELEFMDSTGLHGLLAAKQACARSGCGFMLVRGSAQVQRLFELSGLLDELPFVEAAAA